MPLQRETRGAGGAAGLGNAVCLTANSPENNHIERPLQEQFARLRHGGPANVLPFPPRPRRIEVWISAVDSRGPIGRTRPIRLTEPDLAQLVETAQQLEHGA